MDTQPVQHSRAAQANIKIVGVGGAGVNAVSGLKLEDLGDVGIAAINTDAQALAHATVREKLLIGGGVTRGLGAGGEVELGRAAAEGDREAITVLLGKMDLIILVVGLGGGTGSAAASIVAEVAAKSEALVLAFATLPFSFEGARRKRIAEDGMAELRKVVHGLIPLPNDVLLQEGEEDMSVLNASVPQVTKKSFIFIYKIVLYDIPSMQWHSKSTSQKMFLMCRYFRLKRYIAFRS